MIKQAIRRVYFVDYQSVVNFNTCARVTGIDGLMRKVLDPFPMKRSKCDTVGIMIDKDDVLFSQAHLQEIARSLVWKY